MALSAKRAKTPVMRQYLSLKERYPDAILFFRLGDFYEMFFEDAVTASQALDLTLTARNRGKPDEAPMCGVPAIAHLGYVSRLVRQGRRVAIAEQLSDPAASKGLVERDVVRVYTPGTFIDLEAEDRSETRFLLGLYPRGGLAGAAFLDIASGTFDLFETPLSGDHHLLADLLYRYTPREILLPEDVEQPIQNLLKDAMEETLITLVEVGCYQPTEASRLVRASFGDASVESLRLDTRPLALAAAGAALNYVTTTQGTTLTHLAPPRLVAKADRLVLDKATLKNLEVFQSASGERQVSLLATIDETLTPMGARLLRDWLAAPLCDPSVIAERQDGVATLLHAEEARRRLRRILSDVRDLQRIEGRIVLGTGNPRDMAALGRSLAALAAIPEMATQFSGSLLLETTLARFDPLTDLAEMISDRIVADPPVSYHDGGLIRQGFHREVDELRVLASDARKALADIETRERRRTGIANLKVRYNKVFGYYIEVSKSQLSLVPSDYERKQTLVGAERFATPELKSYEVKARSAREQLLAIEEQLFLELRSAVAAEAKRIQETAHRVALLDLLQSFAETAEKRRYVRPSLSASDVIRIVDGRHPTVEAITGFRNFTPNDTLIDNSDRQILIVTGPNMGGKSTYLRQVAIIALMAQTGCFVPAKEAELGVVDRIFTRVGATDDLARGRSTFLVEMAETANILANATSRSLVILDEIGRGTSTFDGLSIAWAVAEHLHNNPRVAAKTLFATHYHELTDLPRTCPRVKNVQIAVKEWNDEIIFLRKVIDGASDKSYGISVAKLAGLPRRVVDRAREILSNLTRGEFDERGMPVLAGGSVPALPDGDPIQPSLFQLESHPVLDEIRDTAVDHLTPIEALQLIDLWQRRLKS